MSNARLSGMMLDYQKLMKLGINGIIDLLKEKNQNEFIKASIDAMILLKDVIERQKELVNEAIERTNNINRKSELTLMYNSLDYIKKINQKHFIKHYNYFGFMLYVLGLSTMEEWILF